MRIETSSDTSDVMNVTGFLLTRDGGKTMHMVTPDTRACMRGNTEQHPAARLAGMTHGVLNVTFTNATAETLAAEIGPLLINNSTTHHRFRTYYQTEMNMFGQVASNSVLTLEDVWWTSNVTGSALSHWIRMQIPAVGHAPLDALIRAQQEQIQGLPLKRIVVSTQTGANGHVQVSTTTTEVTAVHEGTLGAATFEIPPDYQFIEPPPALPDLASDSAPQP
ncbi:MAG: hypothetical protein O3B24_11385 [Verrucomicrobia bacterium]|nr:hypothetical protein [Verrucomicrobiota bacterium]